MRGTKLSQWLSMTTLIVLMIAGCQSMTGKSTGQNVDDAALTTRVKSVLVADKASNLTRVDVDTNNGVVSLNGVVDSPQQKARAEQLVREVSGVRGVNNNLQVSGRAQTR
ncbi:MAG TPA: BON domain-containing protein [Candidatus Binatia bacterium]|jgi:hyperosmotically inducible protein